MTGLIVLKKNM